jgi:hypothetical protein
MNIKESLHIYLNKNKRLRMKEQEQDENIVSLTTSVNPFQVKLTTKCRTTTLLI